MRIHPIIRHIILQHVYRHVENRKEGKMKKYSFLKTIEKALNGGIFAFLATLIALLIEADPEETMVMLEQIRDPLLVLIPTIVALEEGIRNFIKFKLKK